MSVLQGLGFKSSKRMQEKLFDLKQNYRSHFEHLIRSYRYIHSDIVHECHCVSPRVQTGHVLKGTRNVEAIYYGFTNL